MDRFLEGMANNRYDVGKWPQNAGAHVDWKRENTLHQEFHRKREVAKGEGRGKGEAGSSGYTDNWTGKRPRR
eukprot:2478080-Pyramimonas_sp.AAC.1